MPSAAIATCTCNSPRPAAPCRLGADSDWPGLLDFASDAASNGIFWVNWDGNNSNAAVLNPTGLGGLDITSQGASTGIELNAADDHDGGFIMLKVYTDANDWSWATVPITDTSDGSLSSSDSQFVAFSSFTVGGGTGANFSKVGAIQLAINGANAIDGQVGPIEAVGPMVFSENFVNPAQADLSVVKIGRAQPGRRRQPTDLYLHHDQQRPLRRHGRDPLGHAARGRPIRLVHQQPGHGREQQRHALGPTRQPGLGGRRHDECRRHRQSRRYRQHHEYRDGHGQPARSEPEQQHVHGDDAGQPVGRPGPVKTASPNPVKAGQQLTYTLTATNNGLPMPRA